MKYKIDLIAKDKANNYLLIPFLLGLQLLTLVVVLAFNIFNMGV